MLLKEYQYNRYTVMNKYWAYQPISALIILLSLWHQIGCAIIPPPWSDPTINPCATLPGGWQLLYWAPLKKCFKIFQIGHPCPETMELSPTSSTNMTAECRCPPGTAESITTHECYKLFERGPCEKGEYFSPIYERMKKGPQKKFGECKRPNECPKGLIFWPQDMKCYTLYSRGPCSKGKLLTTGNDDIAECKCESSGILSQFYYPAEDTCHEHFTKGPCQKDGQLFLPERKCGCHSKLPHYHEETEQCYEIGSTGPCPIGHVFIVPDDTNKKLIQAKCHCKEGYIQWTDGICYRLYTRGPCNEGEFLINGTTCTHNFCGKGRLYFPEQKTCYKIGSQGPCGLHEVVVFDFTSRPSIDGISYNGVCGCSGIIMSLEQTCGSVQNPDVNTCEYTPGMVEINGMCYKLYTRGPCGPGQWLEPLKQSANSNMTTSRAKCNCRPGYSGYESQSGVTACFAPSVGLARWILRLIGYEATT